MVFYTNRTRKFAHRFFWVAAVLKCVTFFEHILTLPPSHFNVTFADPILRNPYRSRAKFGFFLIFCGLSFFVTCTFFCFKNSSTFLNFHLFHPESNVIFPPDFKDIFSEPSPIGFFIIVFFSI